MGIDRSELWDKVIGKDVSKNPLKETNKVSPNAESEDRVISGKPSTPDEIMAYERHNMKLQSDTVKLKLYETKMDQEIKELKNISQQRGKHGIFALIIAFFWMIVIVLIILLQGFKFKDFILDETSFLAVIGSLTTSVFGFYYLVIRYFFKQPKVSEMKME